MEMFGLTLRFLIVSILQTTYHFIKENEKAYNRFNYLIQWIDKFHHNFNTQFRPDDP